MVYQVQNFSEKYIFNTNPFFWLHITDEVFPHELDDKGHMCQNMFFEFGSDSTEHITVVGTRKKIHLGSLNSICNIRNTLHRLLYN